MAKNKRLGISVFVVILTIIMAASVIFTFSISYMFSSEGISGKLFGKYIYIMESVEMQPEIEKGSAVIADEDGITVLTEGNVILFKNGGREDVMRIREVIHNTDSTVYRVSFDASPENTTEVSKEKVIAKCTTESHNFGALISFLSSMPGIIVGMLIPCFVILAMLVMKIVSMKKTNTEDNYEESYDEDDDDDDDEEFKGFHGKQMKTNSISPLFNPESDINPGDEFERKKSSIAQNFGQKPANPLKRPTRINQQSAPKEAVKRFKDAVDEKPHAPVTRKSTLVPENANPNVNEKLAAIKAALSQKDVENEEKIDSVFKPSTKVSERTSTFKTIKPNKKTATTPKNASMPTQAPTKNPYDKNNNINSIDDLIKVLEEEKKKL